MQVYFTVNVGRKFWDFSWCPLNRGCPLNMGLLNTGFTVCAFLCIGFFITDLKIHKYANYSVFIM